MAKAEIGEFSEQYSVLFIFDIFNLVLSAKIDDKLLTPFYLVKKIERSLLEFVKIAQLSYHKLYSVLILNKWFPHKSQFIKLKAISEKKIGLKCAIGIDYKDKRYKQDKFIKVYKLKINGGRRK